MHKFLLPLQTLDFPTLVGLVGVLITLIAYFGLQIGKLSNYTITYSLLNLIGSVLILLSLWYHWNLPSVIIELAWIGISVIGLWRIEKNTKSLEMIQ